MTCLDALIVILHAEGVHVQVAAQIGDAAAADGWILLIVDHVLVDHGVLAGSRRVPLVERPRRTVLEQVQGTARQQFADDLVELLLAGVVHLAHGAGQAALDRRRCHKRVERGLCATALDDALDVVDQDVLGLRREVENHVRVHGHEVRAGILDALEDFLATAVLVVAVHLLEQAVVEALHAHGQALHAALQLVQIARDQVVRVRLTRNLLDIEQLARLVDGVAQLIDHDGGGAASNVDAVEVVAQILQHAHLFAHILEVRAGTLLAEREPVEAAVRAQTLAERHVHVQHIAFPLLRCRHHHLIGGLELQVLVRALANHVRKQAL